MSTEAPTTRRGRRTAIIVVVILLFIGSLPIAFFAGPVLQMGWEIRGTRNTLLEDIDHVAVRDAARRLSSRSARGSEITESQLPVLLRELGAQWGHVDQDGRLWVEFGGGFHHHGLFIIPQSDEYVVRDSESVGYTPLVDGMWYYEDRK